MNSNSNPPQEDWFYHRINNIGEDVTLKFVDDCLCGAYELKTNDPRLLH